jgi:hypothetical protein
MSFTPFIPYGAAETFGAAAERQDNANKRLLTQSGYTASQNQGFHNGSVVADTKDGRTVVYNAQENEWRQIGRWRGGYKKIAKTRCAKCAKSSKKCRYSHHKNTAKRSPRRTKQK